MTRAHDTCTGTRRFLRDRHGVVAIEFAMLVPVTILLLFGGFEVTRMVRASLRLNDVAQTVADLVAQQTTVTAASMANFCTGGGLVMTPFSATNLDATVASVTYSSASSSRVLDWQDTTCGSGSAITSPTTLAASYTPNAKDSVVIVQAVYPYVPVVTTLFTTSFTMTRTAYARPRSGTTVTHY
ncbi:pilus assembly protein [Lichenibacterium minor]|uniref:Pilus assembly protein n=1 Tax=Lichenibacterium minor TaxID=2316528 RepID=A0A4Q2U1Y1_9HYPH|nr:pilus assembly protein [Lichenibacterium minor]